MYKLVRTDTSRPGPLGLSDHLAAFRTELLAEARDRALEFKATYHLNFNVEETRTVWTTSTLEEAITGKVQVGDHSPERSAWPSSTAGDKHDGCRSHGTWRIDRSEASGLIDKCDGCGEERA